MDKLKKLFYIIPNTQWNNLILLVFLVLLITILELASITFIYPLVDAIINNKEILFLKKYLVTFQLYFFSIDYKLFTIFIFLGIVIIKNLFLYIFINRQFNFIYNCEKQISENLIKKYTNLNYNFFLRTPSSLLIRNLTHEVHLFNDVLLNYIILISEILVAVCLLTVLFLVNPSITMFLIFNFLLIAVLFNQFFKKKTKKISESLQKFEGVRLQKLSEGFANIKEILIYRLNNFFIRSYGEVHEKTLESRKYSSKLRQYPRLVVETFAITIVCIALIILFSSSLNVSEILPILSLFTLALLRTIPTQNKLIYSFQVIKFGEKTINLLFDNLNIIEDKTPNTIKKKLFTDFVKFENVNFKYDDTQNLIIKNFNFEFKKNKSYVVYGDNGAGKSTLLSIIAGLIKPTKGLINVDGQDIHEDKGSLLSWQKNIGYVPQSIFISDSTLASNIAIGIPRNEINKSKILELSELCQLTKFINVNEYFDEKFTLGEKGNKFSGGQLQRIAIARSLYRNPSILLLDEAMTGIDNTSENELIEIIKKLTNKMTIIMISHNTKHLEMFDESIQIKK